MAPNAQISAGNAVWLDVVAEVRKAIREHDGYIYIPDLMPLVPKGESAADVVGRITAR